MKQFEVLSYGAGQDSTAILYRKLTEERAKTLLVICSDTGNEHPATYEQIERAKAMCEQHEMVEFIHITPAMGFHSDDWSSLQHFFKTKNAIGSKAYPKTCTDRLKLKPIYKYLAARLEAEGYGSANRKKSLYGYAEIHGKLDVMIGIAADEDRIGGATKMPWFDLNVNRVYPLKDWGWDRKACQDYIASLGEIVPQPSNCMYCPYASEQEILWLNRNMPEEFNSWCQLEQSKLDAHADKGDRNLGVWGKAGVTLIDVLAKATEQFGHWSDDRLNEYKHSHGHCMSKY